MKSIKIFILTATLAITALAVTAFINIKPSVKTNYIPGKGFAVVELFTSEGCSSCPPADELVARIQKEYIGQPVYILALHVDYWNHLGWKDAFSSVDYTKRQQMYSQRLRVDVYTPQIVVNGKKAFVGSEENTLRNAITAGLQNPESAQITLSGLKAGPGKATVHYRAEGSGKNNMLILALVQNNAQTNVKAGENKGRSLSHVQIVRKLQSVPLNNGNVGTESLTLPAGFNPQNWEIIGILQNTVTGEILGAAKEEFQAAG